MTLLQLHYTIVVAETQSINAAAKKLYISQPTLSSTIKELEEEMGVQLFHRTNRGISLTQKGEEFLPYARNVLLQYRLLEEKSCCLSKRNREAFIQKFIRYFERAGRRYSKH